MTRIYLTIIAILSLYIACTSSLTYEAARVHIAKHVSSWSELKVVQDSSQSDQLSHLVKVSMLPGGVE